MATTNLSLSRVEAEEFLFREARLLDERRFEEWLDLFTEDGIYWLPIEEDGDPRERVSLVYDDSARRQERIFRLRMRPIQVHSQDPPSRTVHLISNVFVDGISGSEAEVRSSQAVFEIRAGSGDHRQFHIGEQQVFAALCEHRLRWDGSAWRIALKKMVLLNRDVAMGNLQCLL